jgi:hypothetical protein
MLALLLRQRDLRGGDDPAQCLAVLGLGAVAPPRAAGRGRASGPPGAVGFVKGRHRFVDTEIRGVSHHCRIVTYHNAIKVMLQITTSSLL